MRIVFETQPTPVLGKVPPHGKTRQGTARFVVRAFDPGEDIPEIYNYAGPLSKFLAGLRPGQPLQSTPPETLEGALGVAVVPRPLLDSLPENSLLAVEWEFVPGGAQ